MHVSARQPAPLGERAQDRSGSVEASPPWGLSRGSPSTLALAALALLTLLGLALRVVTLSEAMLADELSSYWIISSNDLSGVVSTVHSDAEITPPLFFVAGWLATQIELTPEMARLPSLLAGVATIPVIYLLGLRTVGRTAALVAAAATAFSPFMIYYSAEARGYALLMLLVALSTLAMLLALDTRRVRWWVLYGVCSCAAVYTHYTCVFLLGTQFLWLLWVHREAWRPALIANVTAALGFLPWLSGMRADLDSPTTEILSALTPFDWHSVGISLSHVTVGYPYSVVQLEELPGTLGVVLFVLALALALGSLGLRAARAGLRRFLARADRRLLLVLGLALSVPVAEAALSAVSTNVFGGRNLAASWPAFALCLAALLVAAGPRLRYATVALALGCLVLGALDMLKDTNRRPDYQAVAAFIEARSSPGDVIVDAAVLSPGPLSPFEVALGRSDDVFRFSAPEQRERPFGVFDAVVPRNRVIPNAVAAADGSRVFVLSVEDRPSPDTTGFPARYRLAQTRTWPGTANLRVEMWTEEAGPS